MPLLPESTDLEFQKGPVAAIPPAVAPPEGPSNLDLFAAIERQTHPVASLIDRLSNGRPDVPPVPGFDPLNSIPKGYEQYATRFLGADSPEEMHWTRQRIDQELSDRRTISQGGVRGFAATMAVGMTEPVSLASMAIPVSGPTRLANAARLALVNAGATAADEAFLHQTQLLRTPQESVLNIGAGAILGGILGAAIPPKLSAAELEKLTGTIRTHMNASVAPGESTVGAAAMPATTMAQETIGRGAESVLAGPIGQASPSGRLMNSPSLTVRQVLQELANLPEATEKNYSGIASANPVERILWGTEGTWWQSLQDRRQAFAKYASRVADAGEQPLSRREFNEAIAFAMRRGDQSSIPEVAQAASQTRAKVFQPLYDRAKSLGLVPEDAQLFADSYLTRQYDPRKINANLSGWIETLRDGFVRQGVEPAEATDIAYKATRNVLGSERGTMDWHVMDDIVPVAGQLKQRTLSLPDQLLEPYLNSDIDHLTHSYLRSMAPQVEMTERFGTRDLADQFSAVKDEYSILMERARASGDEAGMLSLSKSMEHDLRDLGAVRDRLYGIFGQPKDPGAFAVRAGRVLRSDNALRLLGAATLAHFPDIANVITKFGMPQTFAAIARVLTSPEALQLTRAEAKRMGAALDMTMNVTASMLGDYAAHSQYMEQRALARATRFFTIATGETPLITAVQALTSTLAQHEIVTAAEKVAAGGSVSRLLSARLASAGIDTPMLERIATEAAEHGREANGLKFGMSDLWTDQGAARAFESAVLRDAHSVTLRPGVGDTPLFMSKELGKTIQQFQSFAFAATRSVVTPLLQGIAHGDPKAAQAMLALAATGTLSYVTKQLAAGQPIEPWDSPRFAAEVLEKSNMLGWAGTVIFPALWQFGFKDLSRWSDRDPVETLLGPSAGTVASAFERRYPARLFGDQESKDTQFRRSDLHFLRRLMPAQNLWYARRAVNDAEDWVGDTFDLPGTSNEQRAVRQGRQ
ncbi:MAG TPA: hypothetical protein VES65_11300 [Solirubrobacteraceae bacterium]|nr:hypothetical protein [Solirubrobacteraceae bacterium]